MSGRKKYNLRKRSSFDMADIYDEPDQEIIETPVVKKRRRILESPVEDAEDNPKDDPKKDDSKDIEDYSKDDAEDVGEDIEEESIDESDDDEEEDEEDSKEEPFVELNDGARNLLDSIMNKADPTNAETAAEKIAKWMKSVPLSKKRIVGPIAEKVYTKIHALPNASDILQSGMPFGEKCVLIEKLEILDATAIGTEEYFGLKKDIFRRIANYQEVKKPDPKLDQLYATLNDTPTISTILSCKAPTSEKLLLLQKLESLHDTKPGSELFHQIKQQIETRIKSYDRLDETTAQIEDMDSKALVVTAKLQDPLRMRILKAGISERNRAVILEKLHQLDMLSTDDSSYGK